MVSFYHRNFNRFNLLVFFNLLKCDLNFSLSNLLEFMGYSIHMVRPYMINHTSLVLEFSGAKYTF